MSINAFSLNHFIKMSFLSIPLKEQPQTIHDYEMVTRQPCIKALLHDTRAIVWAQV